jgi:hypothetical protein
MNYMVLDVAIAIFKLLRRSAPFTSTRTVSYQLTYEKSPAYLGDPKAPYIAYALLPSVKLIAILR